MYYVADHHEAIISKGNFEAAGIIVAQRAAEKGNEHGSDKYQQHYAFSGKIICGECGDTFKRRLHSNTYGKYVAWCCSTHLADKTKCLMLFIRDEDLKVAFVTVLNKLIYSHKLVLKPYATAIQNNSGDENLVRIQHLERLPEQNTEQREILTRLMAQGYIDQVLCNSETNTLLAQANTYREDIDVINATMSGDSSRFFEAERLIHFAERGSMLEEYSEDLFERFADHIHVYSRNEIGFVMKCGLTFKEMIWWHTPLGYRIENGIAAIDEDAAAKVRQLYKNYLSGLSLTNAAKETEINALHASSKRIMQNIYYLSDDFYPAIIDNETFIAAGREIKRRSAKLGRNDRFKETPEKKASILFRFGDIKEYYGNPVKQAEYLYSLIESEVIWWEM